MNKQGTTTQPAGGIEWTHFFGPGTGYTANPVRGCQHQCRWRMPDNQIATCYAEVQKDRLHGAGAFQQVTFHPEVLDDIHRHQQPAGIFIDSMSDLFASAVNGLWIMKVLQAVRACPQHVFFSLTKNPTRFLQPAFALPGILPRNLFLGVSMPPTFMFGKELSPAQQRVWFDKALDCLTRCDAAVRWVSLEPLSWDCSDILAKYKDQLHWAVIGAASNGARTYQPKSETLINVLDALEGMHVFFKGNLRGSMLHTAPTLRAEVNDHLTTWRQEFPTTHSRPLSKSERALNLPF